MWIDETERAGPEEPPLLVACPERSRAELERAVARIPGPIRFLDPDALASALRHGRSRCIVLDVRTGLEPLQTRRGEGGWPCPVVVVGDARTRRSAWLEAGAQECLADALTPERLERGIEDASARWALGRSTEEELGRLRLLADHSSAVAVFDREVRYLAASRRWVDDHHLTDAPIGRSHYDVFPESRDERREIHRRALRGETIRWEEERLDGISQWIGWEVRPWRTATGEIGGIVMSTEDLTAAHRARDEYRHLFEVTEVGNAEIEISSGRFVRVNDAYCRMLGYSADELLERTFLDVTHRDDCEGTLEGLLPFMQGREDSFDLEKRCVRKDGAIVWVHLMGALIRDEGGRPVRILGTAYDVTARKRTEERLVERERQLQQLADNDPDLLTRFDRAHRLAFVNAAVERAIGRPVREIVGRSYRELGVPSELCDLLDRAIERAFATGSAQELELEFPGPDGIQRYSARLLPERDPGGTRFVLGFARDVTEARAAEDALRRSEERLRLALAAAGAGAWEWFVESGALAWSPENYRLYHVDRTPMPPDFRVWHERVHPEDRARADRDIVEALEGRTPEYRSEFRIVHPGGVRYLQSIGRVERDELGRPVRMIGINQDVTEHKLLEEALREADRNKDEFLATLAHELRNSIAPLRTGLRVLESCGSDVADNVRRRMERQLLHLVRLVDDLLDISRIRRGKLQIVREAVQVASIVEDAVESSRPLIDEGRHALAVELPPEPLWVEGDATRLAQGISNLLNNAAKYTPEGGHLALSVAAEGGSVEIRVTDDGVGLEPDELARAFGAFVQVDRTLSLARGGLGIGLPLARTLVELHGGTLEGASGGRGRGSAFTVRLPRSAAPPASAGAAHPASRSGPRRVLVVDDSADNAETLALLLQMSGHDARVARDGPEALVEVRAFEPEIVFLDLGLPGMSGEEVARALRRQFPERRLLLVALTGQGSEEDRRRTAAAGFDHHLTKPADVDQILRLVDAPAA